MKTLQEIKALANDKFISGSLAPIGSMDRSICEIKRESFIIGYLEAQKEINNLPIQIHTGINNTKVSIISGVIIVEPYNKNENGG